MVGLSPEKPYRRGAWSLDPWHDSLEQVVVRETLAHRSGVVDPSMLSGRKVRAAVLRPDRAAYAHARHADLQAARPASYGRLVSRAHRGDHDHPFVASSMSVFSVLFTIAITRVVDPPRGLS